MPKAEQLFQDVLGHPDLKNVLAEFIYAPPDLDGVQMQSFSTQFTAHIFGGEYGFRLTLERICTEDAKGPPKAED